MSKWNWRAALTPTERLIIEGADLAKARWLEANAMTAGIVNRAIQRAKYQALKASLPGGLTTGSEATEPKNTGGSND